MHDCRLYFKYRVNNKDYDSSLQFQSDKKYNIGDVVTVLHNSKILQMQ